MSRIQSSLGKPVTTSSVVDQVVDRLEAAIVSGELRGGERLSEQALAAGMGISRGPLREALRRLEGRGLIERIPNVGARVTQLFARNLEEILVIRESLEALACRLAARVVTDQEIKSLEAILKKSRSRVATPRDVAFYETSNQDFHQEIIAASRNEKLISILSDDIYYLMRFHRYRSGGEPGRAEQALLEHEAIVAALKERSPEKAEAAMRDHLTNAHQSIRSLLAK